MCNVLNEDTMTCDYGVSKVLSKDSSVRVVHSKQQQQQQPSVRRQQQQQQQHNTRKVGVMGSRRIFPPSFKLKVLHSYRNDMDCRGNQRATARKFGIHRRQIQKWLQCEENLKSCAENGNTRPSSTSTTDSSASVSKSSDGATTATEAATGPAVAAAAIPAALNLNVARLHGDELSTQQRSPPPASPPHLPICGASPPAQHRTASQSVLLQGVLVYSQYPSPSDQTHHHHHREAESAMHAQNIHFVEVEDRNCHGDEPTIDVETALERDGDREKIKSHEVYYWLHAGHPHPASDIDRSAQPQHYQQPQPPPPPPQHHQHSPNLAAQGNVDLPMFHGQLNMYGLIGAPLIKTERASPDSAATSGPYEPSGSPGDQWTLHSPGDQRSPESPVVSDRVANNSSGSLPAHFSSATGPLYADVHVREHAHVQAYERAHAHVHEQHAHAPTLLVSNAPYSPRLHQRERESDETTTGYAGEKGEPKERIEYVCETVIKEEVDLGAEDEGYDERQENIASPYIDVTGDLSMDSSEDPESARVEVEADNRFKSSSGYHASSGRSSSTSSVSDMGFLDGAPGNNQNTPVNLTRRQQLRRSFPLSFKLDVLDAFHTDADVAGNQRATARKFDINRRQVQKWLRKETDLRDEVALRRDSRQPLPPAPETYVESPIDLRTVHYVSSDYSRPSSGAGPDAEYGQTPPHSHYYELLQHHPHCQHHPRSTCHLKTEANDVSNFAAEHCMRPCCADRRTTTSTTSSSQDLCLRGSCAESPSGHYYSPKNSPELYILPEEHPPPSKRHAYTWDEAPSPKRFCPYDAASRVPEQDRPLCLVKPKKAWLRASRLEALAKSALSESSDASQPSSSASISDDGILFKPYLDNPVCRPASNDAVLRDLSPQSRENIINNNNNQTTANSGISGNDNDVIICQNVYDTDENLNRGVEQRENMENSCWTGICTGYDLVGVGLKPVCR